MRGETRLCPVVRLAIQHISIHSPHAGRDLPLPMYTPMCPDFNPLSPCGERPENYFDDFVNALISIHSPHAGRDLVTAKLRHQSKQFQSTLPMRGETKSALGYRETPAISIHSPHAGRDSTFCSNIFCQIISIHSPHAGRDFLEYLSIFLYVSFQSTLPMRGETYQMHYVFRPYAHFNPLSPCGERLIPYGHDYISP